MDFEDERLKEKKFLTDRISTTSRNIGYGIVAFFITIHSADTTLSINILKNASVLVTISGVLGVTVLLCDYLQYIFGLISTNSALKRKDKDFQYNQAWMSYRLREYFFWAKQITALIGFCAAALSVLAGSIMKTP